MSALQPPRPSRPAQVWQLTTLLLYQYRGMLLAPAWTLWVLLLASQTVVFALGALDVGIAGPRGVMDPHDLGGLVANGEAFGAILALVFYFFAALGFATSLGYDDRQDRSVLFWMALPIPVWVWLLAGYLGLALGLAGVLASLLAASLILRAWGLAFSWGHGTPLDQALPDLFGHWTVAATLLQILPLLLLWWLPVFSLFMAAATTRLRSPLLVTLAGITVLAVLEWAVETRVYGAVGGAAGGAAGGEPASFLRGYLAALMDPLSALTSSVEPGGAEAGAAGHEGHAGHDGHEGHGEHAGHAGEGEQGEPGWASLLQSDVRGKLYFGLALGLASALAFLHRRRRAATAV